MRLVPFGIVCTGMVAEFRAGRKPVLIATDVAARGLGKSVHMTVWPM